MGAMTLASIRPGRAGRRWAVLLGTLLLCLALLLSVSAMAQAAEGDTDIPTAAGQEAPALDYHLNWGTFALTFGLVILFYIFIFWRSEKEFKKIIDVHFGPRE